MDEEIESIKTDIRYWEAQVKETTFMFKTEITKFGGVGANLEELRIGMKESHENLNYFKIQLKQLTRYR